MATHKANDSQSVVYGAAIPFIVHPIDNGIHGLMNFSLRPAMKKYICGPGQGNLADLDMCEEECNVPEEGQCHTWNGIVGFEEYLYVMCHSYTTAQAYIGLI